MIHPIRINARGRIYRKSKFITIPKFELYESPMVRVAEITSRRFDIINRARNSIMEQEDAAIFRALDIGDSDEDEGQNYKET